MINLLIVDDDEIRNNKLYNAILNMEDTSYLKISQCYSADEARILLKNNYYNLMILDVVLPKKNPSTASSEIGLKLLEDIYSKERYLSPAKIIGITSFISDINEYKSNFEEKTSVVLEAKINHREWINTIIKNINIIIQTEIQKNSTKEENILITLHGIRTYGNWQESIKELINEQSNNFKFYSIKYGFFSVLGFILPFMWNKIIKDISFSLEKIIMENKEKNIYIIAHSFGTYIIVKFLLDKKLDKKIHTLILAGSVLPSNFISKYDIGRVTTRLINDCGINDYVLLFNKIFVWGLGDSGRIGFTLVHSNNMTNRFFKGGHSLYFNKNFYKKFWLPHILAQTDINMVDNRNHKWYFDITEFIFSFFDKAKYIIYIFAFLYVLVYSIGYII